MKIRPIRTPEDYDAALHEIARLMETEPAPGTDDFDTLEVWATLVEVYEEEHHSVGPATAIETIKFHIDRLGWTQRELADQAGIQATHLSAVLNGRRDLSLTQIKKLSVLFDIPTDHLIDNPFRDDPGAMRA